MPFFYFSASDFGYLLKIVSRDFVTWPTGNADDKGPSKPSLLFSGQVNDTSKVICHFYNPEI